MLNKVFLRSVVLQRPLPLTQAMFFSASAAKPAKLQIKAKWKQYMQIHNVRRTLNFDGKLGSKEMILKGPQEVKVKQRLSKIYSIRHQPIPAHDFINFKVMSSGSEILLNLENHVNFTDSELVGGMFEFAKRVKDITEIEWSEHPIVESCLSDLKKRQGQLNRKNIA